MNPQRPVVQDVVIAGAGIGGLTLACALRGSGIRVRVLERAEKVSPVGAGITVQANAMFALRAIGLEAVVAAAGHAPAVAAIMDPSGAVLSSPRLERVTRAVGATSVALHRASLHKVLLQAAGTGVVSSGVQVDRYDEPGARVRVHTSAGTFETDLLVGADGLHSSVRAQLVGDGAARYAGYTSWRGVCRVSGIDRGRGSETWGRGQRFGIVPIEEDQTYWFATANAPPGQRDANARAELLERFGEWHAPIRELLEATRPEDILRTDIADRPPLRRWCAGRVALLGDAAHPMTPNLGQGGCQAIEDAVVLARALTSAPTLEQALAEYETRRVARANAVVTASLRLGSFAQWENPVACTLRRWLVQATPGSVFERQMIAALKQAVGGGDSAVATG